MSTPAPYPTCGSDVFVTINTALHGDEPALVTRPAKIVVVLGGEHQRCNVVATLDGPNDTHESERRYLTPCSKWFGSVVYDPTGKIAPSWRWLAK